MAETSGARIFISYSRKDGGEFAASLRKRLQKQHLSIWQDLIALEGGRDWWSQIEDALKSKVLQHFILVITPAALASPVVRREIRLARQEGKTVCPHQRARARRSQQAASMAWPSLRPRFARACHDSDPRPPRP